MIKIEKLPRLVLQDESVLVLAKQINVLEEQYNEKIKVIKAGCPHSNIAKTWQYPHKYLKSDKGMLLQTECSDCGLIRKKPDGTPWTICEKCWGKMTSEGQGRDGNGDRAHFYKCTKCGHTDYHT